MMIGICLLSAAISAPTVAADFDQGVSAQEALISARLAARAQGLPNATPVYRESLPPANVELHVPANARIEVSASNASINLVFVSEDRTVRTIRVAGGPPDGGAPESHYLVTFLAVKDPSIAPEDRRVEDRTMAIQSGGTTILHFFSEPPVPERFIAPDDGLDCGPCQFNGEGRDSGVGWFFEIHGRESGIYHRKAECQTARARRCVPR